MTLYSSRGRWVGPGGGKGVGRPEDVGLRLLGSSLSARACFGVGIGGGAVN